MIVTQEKAKMPGNNSAGDSNKGDNKRMVRSVCTCSGNVPPFRCLAPWPWQWKTNRGGAEFCRRGVMTQRLGGVGQEAMEGREAGRREQERGKRKTKRERGREDEGRRVEVEPHEDVCLVVTTCELGNGI